MSIDIAYLRALCEGATPGPWTVSEHTWSWGEGHCRKDHEVSHSRGAVRSAGDAAFIAEARTAMPALLDEVEQLRAERAAVLTALDTTSDDPVDIAGWTYESMLSSAAEVDRLNARMSRRVRDHARDVRDLGDARCALGDIATALGLDSDHDDWEDSGLAGMVERLQAQVDALRSKLARAEDRAEGYRMDLLEMDRHYD